jgi:multidrug efflux pump subunit AcrA (membrane-fusion protein)
MSEEEIRVLEKKGRRSTNLYLPKEGDSVWVYATLYEGEMDLVSPGDKATMTLPSSATKKFEGVVRAVDPVVDAMTRSVRARIEVPKAGGSLRPDSYVDVVMSVDLGEQLVIPKSAVIDTGTRRVVFVMKKGQAFESRDIKTGAELADEVVVAEGLHEGEIVVNKATFLVDSESQLKAAVSGGHQH